MGIAGATVDGEGILNHLTVKLIEQALNPINPIPPHSNHLQPQCAHAFSAYAAPIVLSIAPQCPRTLCIFVDEHDLHSFLLVGRMGHGWAERKMVFVGDSQRRKPAC